MKFSKNPTEEKVFDALSPVIETMGAELYEVEWSGGLLKLTVDAEGGANTDRLAEVHRMVFPLVEQQQLVQSNFSLQVTSPGLEKPLTTLRQFETSIGSKISIRKTTEPHYVIGELKAVTEDKLDLQPTEINEKTVTDEDLMEIPFEEINKARTVFDWKAALSKGKKNH